jgi:hypothetical protein
MQRHSESSSQSDAHSQSHAHVILHVLRRSFRPPLFVGFPESNQVLYAPQPIRYASGHSWGHAKCTMDLDEVVGEIVEGRRSRVIFQFFTASIAAGARTGSPLTDPEHGRGHSAACCRVVRWPRTGKSNTASRLIREAAENSTDLRGWEGTTRRIRRRR